MCCMISATLLATSLVSLLLGSWIGFLIGRRIGQLRFFTVAMKVRNPEMWELLHHYVVDEEETRRIRRTKRR